MTIYNTLRTATKPNSRVQIAPNYNTLGVQLLKQHLKIESTDTNEDDLLNVDLVSSIKEAERYTRRVIEPATWRTYLDYFYSFQLDVNPIAVSSIVVNYYDVANALQTLAASEYTVTDNGPDDYAFICFDGTLPVLYDRAEPVYLEYTAGYSYYPEELTAAILKHAADKYEFRTNQQNGSLSETTFSFHKALFPFKML